MCYCLLKGVKDNRNDDIEVKLTKKVMSDLSFEFEVDVLHRENNDGKKKVRRGFKEFFALEEFLLDFSERNKSSFVKIEPPSIEKSIFGRNDSANSVITEKKRLKNIESFLKCVSGKKELWCREVFKFMDIPLEEQSRLIQIRDDMIANTGINTSRISDVTSSTTTPGRATVKNLLDPNLMSRFSGGNRGMT
jgi:hypothetical protein